MKRISKKLEDELQEWGELAVVDPEMILVKTEEIDVTLSLKRQQVPLKLAPHIVKALEQRAKTEGKSIDQIVERWLTEKLFIEKGKD